MEQPKVLLLPDAEGNVYEVKTSYEDLKASINIQADALTWQEMLKEWYKQLLFHYRFDSSMEELKKIGALEQTYVLDYRLDDIHNSLVFIRTKVVKELGNGSLSNLNEAVHRMWTDMEKKAEHEIQN